MREVCRYRPTFFGPNYDFFKIPPEYINMVYEKIYRMKTYMNWSFEEVYMLPIPLRDWFYDRHISDKEEKNKPDDT